MTTMLIDIRPARGRTKFDAEFTAAIAILVVFVAAAIIGVFIQDKANFVVVAEALRPPSAEHWFGTDAQGRDVFARVLVGAGIALYAGTTAVFVGAGLGLVVALLCGMGPRWVDGVLIRVSDAILSFPQLLLALAIAMALGSGLHTAIIGIVITIFPVFARTLRAEALRSRKEPFIDAAVTLGLKPLTIAFRHVVPYVSTTLLTQAAANFGNVILLLAGLSFIGVGAQPPTAEWGAMITDGLQNALTGQWWLGVFPGLALLLVVVAVNLLADSLPRRLARESRRG